MFIVTFVNHAARYEYQERGEPGSKGGSRPALVLGCSFQSFQKKIFLMTAPVACGLNIRKSTPRAAWALGTAVRAVSVTFIVIAAGPRNVQ